MTYLAYQNFDEEPHPLLRYRVKVTLPTLTVDFFDYSATTFESRLDSKEGLFPLAVTA